MLRGRGTAGRQPRQHEVPEDIAVTPRMYQQLALKIAGKPEERILAHLMLRSLRQARYSEKNEGHFALAAPCYTHFTSPIRRYPDLIVHRIAKAVLASGASGMGVLAKRTSKALRHSDEIGHELAPISEVELAGIAYESSQAERRAEDAERELMEWKKVKFMQDRIGDDFDAMILSVTKYGCFVELDNLFIEGLVPIMSLQGDYYTFRENTRQIIGEHSGRRYSMGDRVRVVLDRVDSVQRRLQFSILEEVAPVRLGRPAKAKAKVKSGKRQSPSLHSPEKQGAAQGQAEGEKQAPGQEARLDRRRIYNEGSYHFGEIPMPHMVVCARYKQEMEGLDELPFDSDFGQKIYDQVSKKAWSEWIERQKMLLNEYRLQPWTREAQEFLVEQMQEYFFGEGSALPKEYVPPAH